jgi:alpha 1,3-glucosidase
MLLSISVAGLSFAGADIGGFFGNPDVELMTRWFQAAAFTPFFRNHAHLDSKRREPWVFGEPTTSILRKVTMLRYTLLPLWYTLFFESHLTGLPVLRPLFLEFPLDKQVASLDNCWMVGGSLLVKPVVESNKRSMDVYLPASVWRPFQCSSAVEAF